MMLATPPGKYPPSLPTALPNPFTQNTHYADARTQYGTAKQGGWYNTQSGHSAKQAAAPEDPLMAAYMAGHQLGLQARSEDEQRYPQPAVTKGTRYQEKVALSGSHQPYSYDSRAYAEHAGSSKHLGGYTDDMDSGDYHQSPGAYRTSSDPMSDAFMSGYAAGLGSTVVLGSSGGDYRPRDRSEHGGTSPAEGSWGTRGHQQRRGTTPPDRHHWYRSTSGQYPTRTNSRVSRAGPTADRSGAAPSSVSEDRRHPNHTSGVGSSLTFHLTARRLPNLRPAASADEVTTDRPEDKPGDKPEGAPEDVELAPYIIEAVSDGYERRYYPASRWVCAAAPGAGGSCAGDERGCLDRLRRYLGGENTIRTRLRPTAPLLLLMKTDSDPSSDRSGAGGASVRSAAQPPPSAVCSLLSAADRRAPPPPLRKELFLLRQPATRLYVRDVGRHQPGVADRAAWTEEGERLRRLLRRDGAPFDESQQLAFLYPATDGSREVGVVARRERPAAAENR